MTNGLRGDYDAPWKAIVRVYLRPFLAFYFPDVERAIDWSYEPKSLDKELEGWTPRPEGTSKKASRVDVRVDLLFKIRALDGEPRLLLLHVEIQGDYEVGFSKRIFVYCGRLFSRHQLPVVSLAILGDVDRPKWRPDEYSWDFAGSSLRLKYPVAKLTDYNERWSELEASENPFALVTMAHLKAKETRGVGGVEERARWKRHLLELLEQKCWTEQDVHNLLVFIDRVMTLPTDVNDRLKAEMQSKEQAMIERIGEMGLMTTWEERAWERGLDEGREEGREEGRLRQMGVLRTLAERRFGDLPAWAVERLERASVDQLERWAVHLLDVDKLENVFDGE